MLAVGITGGIGSGKSYICQIFEYLGIKIYYADARARHLSNNDAGIVSQVTNLFGDKAYVNGEYNRMHIASVVFNNSQKLQQLNSIIHPAIEKDYHNWLKSHASEPYTLKEAAILFESGTYKLLDKTILVTAPIVTRINRVVKRDNISPNDVQSRINKQWPTEKILPLADFIIENDGKRLILPQIINLDKKLKSH